MLSFNSRSVGFETATEPIGFYGQSLKVLSIPAPWDLRLRHSAAPQKRNRGALLSIPAPWDLRLRRIHVSRCSVFCFAFNSRSVGFETATSTNSRLWLNRNFSFNSRSVGFETATPWAPGLSLFSIRPFNSRSVGFETATPLPSRDIQDEIGFQFPLRGI